MEKREHGYLMSEGYNCAQSVFGEYAESLGVNQSIAFAVASGFGSGIGRKQYVCGAVSGAIMAIGCACAREESDAGKAKALAYERAFAFTKEFEELHGSSSCRTLLGADLSSPDGVASAKEQGLFTSICHPLVASASELVKKYL